MRINFAVQIKDQTFNCKDAIAVLNFLTKFGRF